MLSTEAADAAEVPGGLPVIIHRNQLLKIGNYIMEGLSEDEACILASIKPKVFQELKKAHENIAIFLEKKRIEFKRKHLLAIHARSSDKNSMWLLEALRPEEFGAKKKVGDTTINVIGSIIKDIQKGNDTPVVRDIIAETINPKNDRDFDPQKALN